MGFFAIFTFCVVFLLIVSGGLLLFYREEMLQRITDVINPHPKPKSILATIQQTGISIGGVVEHFENVLPRSQAETSVVMQRLQRAGFRDESAVKVFYGTKVLTPILMVILFWASGIGAYGGIFMYVVALGIGFLAPDFWLGKRISKRQSHIRRGLPDVLDLLVICIEAGLSLDQATSRTTVELKSAQPELCDELGIVVLEQRAGRPRSEAWKHLAERTNVDCVRNLVSMLVQADQFGSSVAKTLRVHSDTLRTQRVQAVEAAAAKTTIKLIFPLVLFIFPSLFVVTLGPAILSIMESFAGLNH
ncbi:MAG TPA: type II secretion system F family protein [Terracidiphilus sp.]|jgi:tight adherence protein C